MARFFGSSFFPFSPLHLFAHHSPPALRAPGLGFVAQALERRLKLGLLSRHLFTARVSRYINRRSDQHRRARKRQRNLQAVPTREFDVLLRCDVKWKYCLSGVSR